jgi:hypothetical protein
MQGHPLMNFRGGRIFPKRSWENNEEGEEEIWDAQSSTPQNLLRRGWGPDTIEVGGRIIVEGNLGLENSNKLWVITITMENGKVIYASGGDN